MNSLEKYLRELRDIRSTGSAAKETSYYPALIGLLNEVGKTLKPKVRCVLTPKNLGAGVPDIGLFVSRQRFDESEAFINLAPERGVAATASGKPMNREAGDFDVTAGWGHGGKGGITMPGKGKMHPRDYTAAERAAIEQGAVGLGLTPELALAHLGEQTCDVYLNGNAYWRNVPLKVWEYTIGGHQVMKKWLSYRERELLGRALSLDEVREVTNMARRIAAILLLEPQLDANYRAVKENCYDWQANV
jgi:hypothetical protein